MELVGRRASQHRLRRLAHENVTARTCRCLTPAEACTEAHCGPAGGNPRFGQCSPNDQGPIETCATPGPGTQRSRAGASPGFYAVSLRACPSHQSGPSRALGDRPGPALVTWLVTPRALSYREKALSCGN